MLILESLLVRQEVTATHPGDIDNSGSHLRRLFYHVDTGAGKHHFGIPPSRLLMPGPGPRLADTSSSTRRPSSQRSQDLTSLASGRAPAPVSPGPQPHSPESPHQPWEPTRPWSCPPVSNTSSKTMGPSANHPGIQLPSSAG